MKETLVEVSEMVLEKALIAQSSGSQTLRTSLNVDWSQKMAFVTFESYTVSYFLLLLSLQYPLTM